MRGLDGRFPDFVGKITQWSIIIYSWINISLSLFDMEIRLFIVKIIRSHVGNSNSTEKKKNHKELHCPKVLVNIQPKRCLSSLNFCWISVRAELFIETIYGLKLYLVLVFYHFQAAQTLYK